MANKVTRLFEQFQPENYQLQLNIDPEAMSFSGRVTIHGKKTGRPSQRLTFHQKGLKITEAIVVKHDKKGDQPLEISRINKQDSLDEVRLHSKDIVYPGSYTVKMEFEGKITRPLNGIYPCYFKINDKEQKLIATQFESHHAREAFPCIDEPEAKAIFDLTLVTPAGQTVISNTPVKSQETKGKELTTAFETTPKMSTYLLAFVFGNVEYSEAKTKDGVLVRVYATPDNVQHTKFTLNVAVKCLEFYNQYFDIPYPLAKCDFVALPDFASGAMENWGLVTMREQALVDPANTSLSLKHWAAEVIAHELTHQWFGNLVTMRWWTDLWLNESFSTWMSWLAVDKIYPDWKVWTQFIVNEQGAALKLDSLENTHPIEVEVRHPDEIRTIFDNISYEKGASVILMLHDYLGPENFRDGLRLYLKRHSYGNTDTVDLWAALEEVSKKPVTDFMGKWTSQAGYPIVKVGSNGLQQERFYLNPKAKKGDAVWPIPLLPEGLAIEILEKPKQKISESDNLLLNHKRASFYRAVYDSEHLSELAKKVESHRMDELDRLGLLSDAFETAKAGYLPTVEALKLLEAYTDEDSAVVWDVIAGAIGSIRNVMDDDEIRENLKPFVRQLADKQLKRLGWEEKPDDNHFDRLLRPTILGLSSWGEDPVVVKEAKRRFKAMKKPEDVHPDLRGVVYGAAARTGGKPEFDKMEKLHDSAQNSEEKITLAATLTGFKQPELIQRALAKITGENVRIQDALYWMAYSFGNRYSKAATWQWLKDNWDWLVKNIGNDLSFSRVPNYAARGFSETSFLPEFKKFFETHMSSAFERSVKQGIETIEWQAAWRGRDLDAIKQHLAKKRSQ